MGSHHAGRQAFTLFELLIVVTVIAVLASLLIPVVHLVRQQAQMLTCLANQRQVALAAVAYAADNQGALVPGSSWQFKLVDYIAPAQLAWAYVPNAVELNGIGINGSNVIKGCNAWQGYRWDVPAYHGTDYSKQGFAFNAQPDRDGPRGGLYNGVSGYPWFQFKMSGITFPSQRVMTADFNDFYLGDYYLGRGFVSKVFVHNGSNDGTPMGGERHYGGRINAIFFDQHARKIRALPGNVQELGQSFSAPATFIP